MKNQFYAVAACVFVFFFSANTIYGQLPYTGGFKTSSQKGIVVSGAAKLTAATGQDAEGQGYLQLTEDKMNLVGYMYAEDSFPSNYGLTATFEFFTYRTGANGFNQADGICFFLFDASVPTFRPGAFGGSLGYAQKDQIPGMSKGYIGIGIDEFGNFSYALDGGKNGGPAKANGSITVRGPGNGRGANDYVYQTHVPTASAPFNSSFLGFNQRWPDSTSANYRRVKFILTPGSSMGANIGYKVTVIMYKGGATVTPVTLINNFDYPFVAPAQLQYGMAASTGSNSDYHEIRNMDIRATNTSALLPAIANTDNIVTCTGQPAIFDVTTNDVSQNAGGSIVRESIDLNPALAGIQTSFNDPGKGTYSIDLNGNVMFNPATGFSGTSTISYNVRDSYGLTSSNAAINVSLSASQAPVLTIANPAAVCGPATVDITNAAYKTETTVGATFSYFATLSDAYNNTGSLGNAAKTIANSGVYYIKTTANTCSTVKPISVAIDQVPTVSAANVDQNFCTSTGSLSIALAGNTPDVGTGTWTQVSGPTTSAIVNPNSGVTAVNNLEKGVYFYKWAIAGGACGTSNDEVRISVGIPSVAGSNQELCNSNTVTLAGNDASPATGTWSLISGPAVSITAPTNRATTVTGLTPGSTYVLGWRIINGGCNSSTTMTVVNNVAPVSNAGANQALSNATSATLAANTPAPGTGVWTKISGPAATITTPSSPTSTVTGLTVGSTYVFQWTVSNGNCTVASSQVTITNTALTVADAGPDQSVSAAQNLSISGNIPGPGNTGVWTLVSAPPGSNPVFANPNNYATTVTGINRLGDYFFKWTISNGSSTSEDIVKITVLSILPINLVSFDVKMQDGFAVLNWKTPLTNTNKRFTVQRSVNGTDFINLGEVSEFKNIAGASQYSYSDRINGTEGSKLFYRLRQVNQAGIVDYSEVIALRLEGLMSAQFWPNPFAGKVSMKLNFMKPGVAQIRLMDKSGKVLRDYQEKVVSGNNFINIEGLNLLAPGVYQVLISKDGIVNATQLVKQ